MGLMGPTGAWELYRGTVLYLSQNIPCAYDAMPGSGQIVPAIVCRVVSCLFRHWRDWGKPCNMEQGEAGLPRAMESPE